MLGEKKVGTRMAGSDVKLLNVGTRKKELIKNAVVGRWTEAVVVLVSFSLVRAVTAWVVGVHTDVYKVRVYCFTVFTAG